MVFFKRLNNPICANPLAAPPPKANPITNGSGAFLTIVDAGADSASTKLSLLLASVAIISCSVDSTYFLLRKLNLKTLQELIKLFLNATYIPTFI